MKTKKIEKLAELLELYVSNFGSRNPKDDNELINEENQPEGVRNALNLLVNLEKTRKDD